MYLNTIAPADWTLSAINQTDTTLATLEAELATGATPLAVNPADTIMSTQMQGQLGVLSQTQQNLQQNTDLLQTASGATQSIQGILQQMQALAVQASNGTESPQNRSALQDQYNALLNSVATISQVQYNGIALLNPTNPSEILYAANDLPTEEITASSGTFNVQNVAPTNHTPMITAITFASIGTPTGQDWSITIHGVHFQPLQTLDMEDVPSFSMVVGPPLNHLNDSNPFPSNTVWAQFGYTGSSNVDGYLLNYSQSSSTAITIQGAGGGYSGKPPMDPGSYINFAVEGPDGHWALWQGSIPSVATTIEVAFPVQQIPSGAQNAPALTLPVVTPITLGLETLSLATPSSAQASITALQTAQARLAHAQAQLGSQQDALLAQQANTQTQAEQLQSSEAALIDINLPLLTQQMSRAQVLQQSGLHVLINERTLRQQAAHVLQSMI